MENNYAGKDFAVWCFWLKLLFVHRKKAPDLPRRH